MRLLRQFLFFLFSNNNYNSDRSLKRAAADDAMSAAETKLIARRCELAETFLTDRRMDGQGRRYRSGNWVWGNSSGGHRCSRGLGGHLPVGAVVVAVAWGYASMTLSHGRTDGRQFYFPPCKLRGVAGHVAVSNGRCGNCCCSNGVRRSHEFASTRTVRGGGEGRWNFEVRNYSKQTDCSVGISQSERLCIVLYG